MLIAARRLTGLSTIETRPGLQTQDYGSQDDQTCRKMPSQIVETCQIKKHGDPPLKHHPGTIKGTPYSKLGNPVKSYIFQNVNVSSTKLANKLRAE